MGGRHNLKQLGKYITDISSNHTNASETAGREGILKWHVHVRKLTLWRSTRLHATSSPQSEATWARFQVETFPRIGVPNNHSSEDTEGAPVGYLKLTCLLCNIIPRPAQAYGSSCIYFALAFLLWAALSLCFIMYLLRAHLRARRWNPTLCLISCIPPFPVSGKQHHQPSGDLIPTFGLCVPFYCKSVWSEPRSNQDPHEPHQWNFSDATHRKINL